MTPPERPGGSWLSRLGWFALLWAGGVAAVGCAAAVLRFWLAP